MSIVMVLREWMRAPRVVRELRRRVAELEHSNKALLEAAKDDVDALVVLEDGCAFHDVCFEQRRVYLVAKHCSFSGCIFKNYRSTP